MDPESAAGMARLESKDAQIDQGLDALGRSIDNIHSISNAMKQEVRILMYTVKRLDLNVIFALVLFFAGHPPSSAFGSLGRKLGGYGQQTARSQRARTSFA